MALTPPVLVVSAAAATTSKSVSVSVSSQSATNQLPIILAHWFHTVLGPRAASEHHSPVLKALSHSVTPSIFDRHTELFSFTQYVAREGGVTTDLFFTTAPQHRHLLTLRRERRGVKLAFFAYFPRLKAED